MTLTRMITSDWRNRSEMTPNNLGTSTVRFMLDGENIDPDTTPAAMDLEDDDQIDCFLAQVGGASL